MITYRSLLFRCLILIILLVTLNFIMPKCRFQSLFSNIDLFNNQNYDNYPPNDDFTQCLLHAEEAFKKLSLQWFLVFGSALMYHRSNNFISDDIDIGIFNHNLHEMKITEQKLISTLISFHFKLLIRYGQKNDGQGWTLQCPKSKIHFGIFVFYRINFKIKSEKPFEWWTASYNGLCAQMPYKKCRRGFSKLQLEKFQMYDKVFHVVSKQFLIDQYGLQWMIPRKYNYDQSIKIMTNLIDKKKFSLTTPKRRRNKI